MKLFSIFKPLERLLKLQKGERSRRNSACTTSTPLDGKTQLSADIFILALCLYSLQSQWREIPNSGTVHKKSTSGWINPSLEVTIYFLGHEGVWMTGSVSPFSVKAGPCRELSQRNRAFLTDLDKRESSAHPETSPTTAKISCSGDLSLCLLKELLSWRTHFRRAFSPQNDF